jgi:hypothetical protein
MQQNYRLSKNTQGSHNQRNQTQPNHFGFLDRSRYFSIQVAQLSWRGWVDPVPDLLLLRKSGSAGNRTRTSGSVARNSGHQTTGQLYLLPSKWRKYWWQSIMKTAYMSKDFMLVLQIKISDLNEVRIMSSAFLYLVERAAFEWHINRELYWNNYSFF